MAVKLLDNSVHYEPGPEDKRPLDIGGVTFYYEAGDTLAERMVTTHDRNMGGAGTIKVRIGINPNLGNDNETLGDEKDLDELIRKFGISFFSADIRHLYLPDIDNPRNSTHDERLVESASVRIEQIPQQGWVYSFDSSIFINTEDLPEMGRTREQVRESIEIIVDDNGKPIDISATPAWYELSERPSPSPRGITEKEDYKDGAMEKVINVIPASAIGILLRKAGLPTHYRLEIGNRANRKIYIEGKMLQPADVLDQLFNFLKPQLF